MLSWFIIGSGIAKSATITWGNTNGGDWNIATNWSPNQVPADGDDVIITNSGTYTVTNAPSVTLDSLILGGTNGIQTLTIASLTLTNASMINSNGVLNWNGGDLESSLTVLQGGTLSISNTIYFDESSPYNGNSALTNYGTVVWAGNITSYANEGSLGGSASIDNAGLWEAVGDNTIGYVTTSTNFFMNTGTLEKIGGTGTSTINWGFTSSGIIQTTSGSFNLNWNGPSTLHGNLTLSGTIVTPLIVASNAVLNLSGGDLESSLTVLQGGTLSISNTIYFDEVSPYNGNAALTNYGTVIWAGNITSYANEGSLGGSATIDNAGLWEAVGDNSISLATISTNTFINTGTLEKTGGTSTSTIGWSFINNGGTVNTSIGSFSMGNWIDSGLVYGNATFSGGTIAGTLAPDAMMNFSATINAALTVSSNAVANWNGGDLESSLTVLQGGTLSISNTIYFDESSPYNGNAALTNYGTVVWAGNITSYANEGSLGGSASIDNAGLWEAVGDNTIGYVTTSTNFFMNTGTLEKIGGTGTSTINWGFTSSGIIQTTSGSFNLNWNGPSTLHGNLTLSGTIVTPLIVASNAVLNLSGGDLESSLTVLQGGTLSISNTIYFDEVSPYNGNAALTNYGTVIWAGNITSYANEGSLGGSATIDNAGLWEAVGDNSISLATISTNTFINTGTLEKTGGTSTSTIGWNVLNSGGILGSQTNTLSLAGDYDLTGGTLNVGINSLANYGIINLSGSPAALTGTLSANLNNGYVPATGSSFPVLTYGSESGAFTNFNLPFAVAWQTNYGGTTFTLTVLNVRPTLAPTANQTVDELTLLTVTNGATDPDIGQTLTFALVSAPGGMSINPTTGTISWTPAQTQSPSTNTILVSVTDNGTPPLSATNSFNVVVKEVNVAPSLPTISTQIVNELTLLTVTNTATEFNIHSTITGYGLINPPLGMNISASGIITWTPAQTQSPGTNTITTVVTNFNPYDLVNPQLMTTNSFVVIVKEVNVAPTLPAVSTQTVNELALLTVTNTATNFNIHSTVTGYRLVNPPTNMVINASGIITWTPAQAQSPGTNTVTTIVTNSNPYDLVNPHLTSTNQFAVIVKEVNVAPSLPTISTQIVNELTLLTVTNTATNANIHSTIIGYRLVNPPTNMVINASGVITWTPAQAQSPSTNTIITIVTNSNPYDVVNPQLMATNSFVVIVKEVNVAPVLPVIPTQTVNAQALLTVTNTASESNIHATLGYALASPPVGMSISANGVITWTPARSQGPGTNIITTVVTNTDSFDAVNPHLSATNSFTVIVYAPTLAPIGNYTVNAGQIVTFTATATDNDSSRTLTFSLFNPPVGATLNPATGLFSWRPGVAAANTTNIVQVSVTDNSTPPLSDTKSFTVTVNPLAPVVLTSLGYTNSQFKLQVSGTTGPDYIIMTSGSLTNWTDLTTNLSPATPFQYIDTNALSSTNRFYRVRLSP